MTTQALAGNWGFSLDAEDRGLRDRWFSQIMAGQAELPGSLAVQGIGEAVTLDTSWTGTIFNPVSFDSPDYAPYRQAGNIKFPFWLQPEKVYAGAAWFQREIAIPNEWQDKRVELLLERPHWFTQVWLDETELGTGDSLSTPHRFELGNKIAPGLHRLTLRVDNCVHVAVGENAHSVSDHTQGNWNGIIGRIELLARGVAWFDELELFPDVARRSVEIRGTVAGAAGCRVCVSVAEAAPVEALVGTDGSFSLEYSLGLGAQLWSEYCPALHTVTLSLVQGSEIVDTRNLRFGLREIGTRGTQFVLNGQPVFFRGTLECCIFPRTGHPPMDLESWRRVLQVVKAHGLNHIRFHSWCPPEAAFLAGDELGIYFQVEVATWPNAVAVEAGSSPAGIGDGTPVDAWVYAETRRILREYGNHPCFVLMAAGNEPGGPNHASYLGAWVAHFRALDSRRLFTGTAGWPELSENQFHVIPEPRGHQWLDGLRSRFNREAPSTTMDYREAISKRSVPLISHEIGQWCSYPPLKDAAKYSGHLKAKNYEIFAESLAAKGLAGQLDAFVEASGKLQTLCYKEEIESALRTPGMGGFQLLDLRDFPGQGTAPVGVLNAFWESKGYITSEAFRRFCGPTVLLARLSKRVFSSAETLKASIDIAHFGPSELVDAVVSWRVVCDDGFVVGRGLLAPTQVTFGAGLPLGELSLELGSISSPSHLKLIVELESQQVSNDWDLWVYPETPIAVPGTKIVIVTAWNAEVEKLLDEGAKVLFLQAARSADRPVKVELGFTPIFWNTWCTKGQAPHTLGILCDPAHAALASFPTTSHTDWNWWYLLNRSTPWVLDGLPSDLHPIVQVIDDWYTNRRLGLVLETKVGSGSLLLCGVDLSLTEDPVKRQFLSSLLRYMESDVFRPSVSLTHGQVASLLQA